MIEMWFISMKGEREIEDRAMQGPQLYNLLLKI